MNIYGNILGSMTDDERALMGIHPEDMTESQLALYDEMKSKFEKYSMLCCRHHIEENVRIETKIAEHRALANVQHDTVKINVEELEVIW